MNKKGLFEEANFLDDELRKVTAAIKENPYHGDYLDYQIGLWEIRDKIEYAIKKNNEELKKIL